VQSFFYKPALLTACLLIRTLLYGQVVISGTVTDTSGKPLATVDVILQKKSGLVLAFAPTNNRGAYKISYAGIMGNDTLLVEVNSIGYFIQQHLVRATVDTINFKLRESFTSLPQVVVKGRKSLVEAEGDTLSYNVASFTAPQDRVIGDIIKKLPGINVDENGKITYQGKDLNQFYIDGDNLLDGKYNIATQNLPADMVDKIQVLDNHQPIKVLKNVVQSDNAAINIVLKDKSRIKLAGNGEAGAGVPGVYTATVNAMLFKKQYKFINYIKADNTGDDLNDELMSQFGTVYENKPVSLLSISGTIPPLKKARYLFNNAALASINDLFTVASAAQLKLNAYFITDRQYQNNSYSSDYFLPVDTLHYYEQQNNLFNNNSFSTQLNLNINRSTYYLNDVLLFEYAGKFTAGNLTITGNYNVAQRLQAKTGNVSNLFNYITITGSNKNVTEVYSYAGNVYAPAQLNVEPGLNDSLFNNGVAYNGLIQQLSVPSFYTNNYISYKTSGIIRQGYKTGVSYQQQEFTGNLQKILTDNSAVTIADSFVNRLQWQRVKYYLQADYTYVTTKLQAAIMMPVAYQNTDYAGKLPAANVPCTSATPTALFKYTTGRESYIQVKYVNGNYFGDITNVYDGYVMQTYKFFSVNNTILPHVKSNEASVNYAVQNTLKVFFLTVSASYKSLAGNVVSATQYNTIFQQQHSVAQNNTSHTASAGISVSKYIFAMKATIGAKALWQRSDTSFLQNGSLLHYLNNLYNSSVNAYTKPASWCNLSYTGSVTVYSNRPTVSSHNIATTPQVIFNQRHQLALTVTVKKNIFVTVNTDYYAAKRPGDLLNKYVFTDATLMFKLPALKTDIQIVLSNLANVRYYTNLSVTSNQVSENTYQIRPRMALARCSFRF